MEESEVQVEALKKILKDKEGESGKQKVCFIRLRRMRYGSIVTPTPF